MSVVSIEPENVDDFINNMQKQNLTVTYGEPLDLIWRLANACKRELDEAYNRIEELERMVGL